MATVTPPDPFWLQQIPGLRNLAPGRNVQGQIDPAQFRAVLGGASRPTGTLNDIAAQLATEQVARGELSALSGPALPSETASPNLGRVSSGRYRNVRGQIDPRLFAARQQLTDLAGASPPFAANGPVGGGLRGPLAGLVGADDASNTRYWDGVRGRDAAIRSRMGGAAGALDDLAMQAIQGGDEAAAAVSQGGRLRAAGSRAVQWGDDIAASLGQRQMPSFSIPGGTAGAMARLGGMGGLAARAGTAGGIAMVANPIIDQVVPGSNSNWEQGLQGAATGAAIGATIGAPAFGVGAGVGAAVGGALGGIAGVLLNGGDPSPEADTGAVIGDALSQSGLAPDYQSEIMSTYNVLMSLANGNEAEEAAARQQVGAMIVQSMQEDRAAKQSTESMLASQALAGQFFQPFTGQMLDSANLRADITSQMADSLPGPYQAVARQNATNALDTTTRLASAFSAQAQLIPSMRGLEIEQQRLAQGGSSGGNAAFNDLLAQAMG